MCMVGGDLCMMKELPWKHLNCCLTHNPAADIWLRTVLMSSAPLLLNLPVSCNCCCAENKPRTCRVWCCLKDSVATWCIFWPTTASISADNNRRCLHDPTRQSFNMCFMPDADGHTKPDETHVLTIHSRFLLQVKVKFVRPDQDFYLHNQLDKVLIILYIKDFSFLNYKSYGVEERNRWSQRNYVHNLFKDFFSLTIIKEMKFNTSHKFSRAVTACSTTSWEKLFLLHLRSSIAWHKPVIHTERKESYSRWKMERRFQKPPSKRLSVLEQSPWIVSPQESLIDVRF